MNRNIPSNPEAEEYLLSCCLLDGADVVSRCIEARVTPDAFYEPKHGLIFECLVAMLSEGKVIDISVLAEELKASRRLDTVGGYAFLTQVSSRIPTTAQAGYFIERVREMHTIRCAIREAQALLERCYSYAGSAPTDEVLDGPVSRLMALAAGAQDVQEPSWAEVVDEAEKVLENIIANQGMPEHMTIPFPWPVMNELFQPMQRGQLVEIAARPSVGKSSLARPIALHAAQTGRKVYFVTLEVNPVNVVLQMAAAASRVGIRQVAKAHHSDQTDLRRGVRALRALGVTVSRRDRTIARILARARALHAKGALDLLVIDHGLLVEDIAAAGANDLQQAVGRLTKGLKAIAQDLGIVCVLLWQLNRASAKESNREPNLTDLKGCGSLEEDADKILFIHRPGEDPYTRTQQAESSTTDELPRYFQNIIQAKGRDDGTSILSFYFERATASFTPIQRNPTP